MGDAIADGGRALGNAGIAQQDAVGKLALALALVVAVVPMVWVLARWLPARIRWVRDATAARRLVADGVDLRLFALRAVATAPLPELARITADPMGDLDRGEVASLAAWELRRLGLATPGGGGLPLG